MTYADLLLLAFVAWLAVIAAIDVRMHRAPNRIVYPSIVLAALAPIPLGWPAVVQALGGGVLAFALLAIVVLAGRGRMGAGDAKVGAVAGLAVGASGVPTLLATAFIGGSAFALVMLGLRVRTRHDVVAFTPMLLAGALAALATQGSYLVR